LFDFLVFLQQTSSIQDSQSLTTPLPKTQYVIQPVISPISSSESLLPAHVGHTLVTNPDQASTSPVQINKTANSTLTSMNSPSSTGRRSFPCDMEGCAKVYSTKSSLKKHKQSHTGERPFICDIEACGKKFILAAHLTRHLQTHTGFRPHACDFADCGKRFLRFDDLKTHRRIHTGEKPYACDIPGCTKRFTQGCALTRHKRTRHAHLQRGLSLSTSSQLASFSDDEEDESDFSSSDC
jgi:uncharacterized Zn-finger protein